MRGFFTMLVVASNVIKCMLMLHVHPLQALCVRFSDARAASRFAQDVDVSATECMV